MRGGRTGNLRAGVMVIEQRQLTKQRAVGRLQRHAQRGERGFIQRMAEVVGGGYGSGGDIGGAAGHPFGNRQRRIDLNAQRRA